MRGGWVGYGRTDRNYYCSSLMRARSLCGSKNANNTNCNSHWGVCTNKHTHEHNTRAARAQQRVLECRYCSHTHRTPAVVFFIDNWPGTVRSSHVRDVRVCAGVRRPAEYKNKHPYPTKCASVAASGSSDWPGRTPFIGVRGSWRCVCVCGVVASVRERQVSAPMPPMPSRFA